VGLTLVQQAERGHVGPIADIEEEWDLVHHHEVDVVLAEQKKKKKQTQKQRGQ